jgi:hypothetical protein
MRFPLAIGYALAEVAAACLAGAAADSRAFAGRRAGFGSGRPPSDSGRSNRDSIHVLDERYGGESR